MLSKRRIEISTAKTWINQVRKWVNEEWSVAKSKISVLLIQDSNLNFCNLKKIRDIDLNCLHCKEKESFGKGLMKWNIREVINCNLRKLNS